MRDWRDIHDRRKATILFRDFMEQPANAQIKKSCCDYPKEAKRQFAIIGEFYLPDVVLPNQPAKPGNVEEIQIPRAVEFKVYDSEDERRNDLVVLVLPSSKGEMSPEPTDVWIAAWPLWVPIDEMIAQLEARLARLLQEKASGPQ
ncbi:MAG: hypothetical protein V7609_2346 [Verrucomicrobiota bacterium]